MVAIPEDSNRLRCMIPRHSSACPEHLPPVAAMEVKYFQNFFPFPRRKQEKEALEDDDLAADWRKDDPDADPVDFLA